MVDRLSELKTDLISADEVEPDVEAPSPSTKPKSKKELKEEEEMQEFFAEAESIKQKLATMRRNIKYVAQISSLLPAVRFAPDRGSCTYSNTGRLKRLTRTLLQPLILSAVKVRCAPTFALHTYLTAICSLHSPCVACVIALWMLLAEASEELEKLVDDTNLNAADVRNSLKEMQEVFDSSCSVYFLRVPPSHPSRILTLLSHYVQKTDKYKTDSSNHRIRTNMQTNLTKKFLDLMKEYQEKQQNYDNKYKELLRTRLKIGACVGKLRLCLRSSLSATLC